MSVSKLFFLIVIALLLTLAIITRKPLQTMSQCYETATTDVNSSTMQEAAMNQDLRTVCELGQKNILELRQCLSSVETKNSITAYVVWLYSFLNSDVNPEQTIEKHNQACISYPETIID